MIPTRTFRMLAALSAVTAPASLAFRARLDAQDTAHVVIVSTTDIHGHATGWDFTEGRAFRGGLTRAATVIDSLRAQYPGQVVLVDGGDLLEGDPFDAFFATHARTPHPLMEAMDALEYDAIVPGNHEFNYGYAYFRQAFVGRNFRAVCANCVLPGAGYEGADSLMFSPFITVPRGKVRVAVAGLTTPGSMVWDREHLRGKLVIKPIGDRSALFHTMRGEADVVVAVIHSGMDGTASYDTAGIGDENVAASLAAGTYRPDVVVVGHSHREMRDSVINGVHFVQPKNWAQSVSVMHLSLQKSGLVWRVVAGHGDLVPLADEPESGRITRRLDPLVGGVKDWTEQWIGFATGAFDARASRAGATALTAWIGDVERRAAQADLAAVPAFSITRGLPEGDIHRNDMFGIYPYENTLRAIRISGAQLRAYLEQVSQYYVVGADGKLAIDPRFPGYNFDVIIGADYDYDLGRPVGQRVIRLAARGRAVAPTDSFTLALSNYRQTGGGGFTMLAGARVTWAQPEGAGVRDLLEAAVKADTLRPERYTRESWRILPRDREDQARALAGAPLRARPSAPRDTILLRILATNDLHGQLDARVWPWSGGRPVGGLSNVKTVMDSLTAECNCPVVKLDAGDEFQGTLGSNITFGRPVVDAFNRIGIQAAATGNHDYDWGVDSLQHRIAESHYPWLASNVVDSATGRRPDWVKSWTMLTAGNVKVAVIGYAHPATPAMTFRASVAGLRFIGGPAPILTAIAEARAQHPDFVVLLAHYGGDCHDTCGGDIFALVDSLGAGAVDAVIGGHTHGFVRGTSSTGVPILQGGSSGRAIAQIDLVRTVVGAREVRTALDTVWADRVRPDRGVDEMLARYRPMVDSLAHRRVAVIAIPLDRRGNDYALGRLIADAYRNALRSDLAIVNNGGIRRDIPAGTLDFGTAYELMPFGNRLVKVTLPGSAVKQILENVLGGGAPDAHLSGAVVRWDSTAERGRRVKEVRFLDGRKLEDKKQYTLTVPDFLAQGGEVFGPLTRFPQEALGVLDLDAFIGYLRRLPQPIQPPNDPRFVTR